MVKVFYSWLIYILLNTIMNKHNLSYDIYISLEESHRQVRETASEI